MRKKILAAALTALALAVALLTLTATGGAQAPGETRDVLYVGNNWDGTADVIDPVTFQRITRLNIIPDKEERLAEIMRDPAAQGYFLGIREAVGEGNDQFVDDMFSSPDGRFLYVSRPSFADVVGIDLRTRQIVWRIPVDGYRSDHMAISPDGSRLLVSASTAKVVHVIDPRAGKLVGSFPSGDQPHENTFSADGRFIFHASIGSVFTPADDPSQDAAKGERLFLVIDANTLKEVKRLDMGKELAEFGRPGMSSSVRPMTLSPDEKFVYFQVSFFHGFVEYDLEAERVTRVAELPLSQEAAGKRRDEYLLDSAHHGLTMNPEGTKLCVAGTMSNYGAIVDRDDFSFRVVNGIDKPYWSTNSGDGKHCFISASGADLVSVISYETGREVARFPVGDHPQRMRMGKLATGAPADAGPAGPAPQRAGGGGPLPRLVVSVSPRRVVARRAQSVRVRVRARQGARLVPVPGARVQLAGARGVTDARGYARLRKRAGFERVRTYRVRASRIGYRTGTASVRSLARRR